MDQRWRRWVRWMLLIAVPVLVVLGSMVLPVPAPAAQATFFTTISLSPSSGPPGARITVHGRGFDPFICQRTAGLRWRGSPVLRSVTLRADGTFTATVRAPRRGLIGSSFARLVATCGPGLIALPGPRATFRLTAAAPARPAPAPAKPAPAPAKPAPSKPAPAKPAPAKPAPAKPAPSKPAPVKPAPAKPAQPDQSQPAPRNSAPDDSRDGGNGGGGSGSAQDGGGTSAGASEPAPEASSSLPDATPTPTPAPGPSPGLGASPAPSAAVVAGAPAVPAVPAVNSGVLDASDVLHPALITRSVPTAADIPFAPEIVLLAAALAGLFLILVAFPAELFNSTLDENEGEIAALLAGPRAAITGRAGPVLRRARGALGIAAASRAGDHRSPMRSGPAFATFVIVGTALTLILAGDESAGGNWPAQVAGLMLAIALVTVIAEIPEEYVARRYSGVGGRFQVLPAAIVVAVICTLVSRVLHLQPAYMYGLFAGFAATGARAMTRRQEGRAVLASVASLSVSGLVAWLIWTPVHHAAYDGAPSWPAVLGDSVLFWVFVLSAEGLVFALIPLRFLDGSVLRKWRLIAWLLPQVASAAFFLYVFVLHGDSPVPGGISLMLRALAFFALFGAISVAFWAYFQWEGRPTREREPADV